MIRRSIRTTLYLYVIAASTVALAGAAAWMYTRAHGEIDALQDAALEAAAQLILAQAGHEFSESYHDADVPAVLGNPIQNDAVIQFQIWSADGTLRYRSSPLVPEIPLAPVIPKFSQTTIGGRVWRTVTLTDPDLQIRLVMAEPESVRTASALRAIGMIWIPAVLILLAALLAIALGIHRSLRPLSGLTALLRANQSAGHVQPLLDPAVPRELAPVLEAYNHLVQQAQAGWARERRYTADVAHELRTPLSVIATQVALMERQTSETERAQSTQAMRGAIQRAAGVIDQLLLLARLDAQVLLPDTRADVREVMRTVLAELDALAVERSVELELVEGESVCVRADTLLLAVAASNLVANAVRHAPARTTVVVSVTTNTNCVEISVEDAGPGVTPELREEVFERFARGEKAALGGAGLGLPIAREIARRYGGDVVLLDRSDEGPGLRAVLWIPVADGTDVSTTQQTSA